MNDQKNTREELRKKVEGQRFFMLTSVAEDGALVSRPMTAQEFDGWTLRFITQASNDVVAESDGKQVNLAAMDGGTYVSLSGSGNVSTSVEDKKELWGRLNEAYAGDAEDPENVVLNIEVSEGTYWDGGNLISRVIGLAKAAITGDAPDGEHGTTKV